MKCVHCGHTLPDGKLRCVNSKCRMWNTAANAEDTTVLLSDAKLSEVERITTGLVDFCFGGGMARIGITLLGGDPGAGKTTLCLQLSDIFASRFRKEVLYIANEQHASELKETSKRLKLKHANLIRIVNAMGGVTQDIGTLLLRYAPCLVILDSVTKWSGEDMNEAVIICQRLKDYTVRLNAPTIVINQVTKGGEHAGLNKMQHAVDATMLFEVLGSNPDSPRRLHVEKNRHGPAPVSQFYEMTAEGLFELDKDEVISRIKANTNEENELEDGDNES
jgi:DNA repair protein RadA/Sms